MSPETLDAMRSALARCRFLPGHPHKRFARDVAAMQLEKLSERQIGYIVGLCWRYRRQMPRDLIPSKDAADELHRVATARLLADEIRKRERREERALVRDGMELPL